MQKSPELVIKDTSNIAYYIKVKSVMTPAFLHLQIKPLHGLIVTTNF